MTHDPTFWLLARSAGFTAYVLLTLSVLAGLVVKSRPFRGLKPAQIVDTHRTLAMLGLGALAIHGTALVLDQTVRMPVWALVVPFTSSYRPVATAIGVLTAELMILVYASFSMRKRIGPKNWRRLHYATFAIFAGATVHGLMSGTDTTRPWAFALYLGAVASVATATAYRALARPVSNRPVPKGATS